MFHHDLQEADDDLGAWSEQHLALVVLLSGTYSVQSIGQHTHQHHDG